MPHGCVTGGHRLTVHADLLSQASGDARLASANSVALDADPVGPTHEPSLRIDECDMMRRPTAGRPTSDLGSIARGTCVDHSHCRCIAALHDAQSESSAGCPPPRPSSRPEPRQAQNPRTIASRSHRSSLVGCTSRENTIQFRMTTWGRSFDVQATEQTAHPNCGPAQAARY
jgi:hypothetical protein